MPEKTCLGPDLVASTYPLDVYNRNALSVFVYRQATLAG
jgi:hypothetical protein